MSNVLYHLNRTSGSGPALQHRRITIKAGGIDLVGYQCHYDVASYHDSLFHELGIAFPPNLEKAVAKRRSDYLAGRYCAALMLHHLGVGAIPCDIPTGQGGEPLWPSQVVGSISHTAGLAICIATTRPNLQSIGVDIEREIPAEVATNIARHIIKPEEVETINRHFPTFQRGLTVVFSAKESIYKALYPNVRRFFDFFAVTLTNVDGEQLEFVVSERLSPGLPLGRRLAVSYQTTGEMILTVVCLERE